MNVSRRISSVQPSPTLALNAKAVQLTKQGHKVLNFAVGEPDYPTADIVIERAVQSLKAGRTRYTPAGGGPELRQAIVDKLKRDNQLTFTPDQIVVGAGAKEILFHTFLSLLNADQIKAAGATPVIVPVPDNAGMPSLDVIESYVTPKTKVFVFNSPNNPAGYILNDTQLQSLANYLKHKSWWIISDEIYEYMSFDVPHKSLLQVCPELRERFILVNGMSKAFAMTGWRVGYCAAPKNVATLVKSLQSHSSTCIPGFIEDAAVVALNAGRPLMAHHIEKLKQRRDIAIQHLKKLGGFKYLYPQGAFYIFIDIRDHLHGYDTSLQFSERLLQEYHLAMAPGEAFGSPGFLRLSYAVDEATLIEGIDRLHKALFKMDNK
jgi:aspartate aminotransferase